jgi:CheY-like chemotaxis protein
VAVPRVLVVDDDETIRMLITVNLELEGFEVHQAVDGLDALGKVGSVDPHVITLDVMMPNLDGLSACAAIRADEATAHIPIVMVTTRGEEHNIETAFRNGCTDYVTKPINGLELLTKLHNILGLAVAS